MFKKCGKIMEKHVGQSSALQEIDRWSSCKFSTAGKHSVIPNIRGAQCLTRRNGLFSQAYPTPSSVSDAA